MGERAIAWLSANWMWLAALLAFYVVLNLAKMPPPKSPWARVLWSCVVRAMVTSWDTWGVGFLKLPGTVVPLPHWMDPDSSESLPSDPGDPPSSTPRAGPI